MTGFGATPTTTGQGTLAANQMPISSVAVPGHANGDLTALEGGPESTDSNSNKTAPASVYIKDGNDVTMGTQADAAWGGSGSATQIAILKKLVAQLNAALSVSGTVTANAGTGTMTVGQATGTNLHTVIDAGNAVIGHVINDASSAIIGGVELIDSAGTNKATISASGAVKVDNSAIIQPVIQSDLSTTGTLTAAQPTQQSAVAGGTVSLNLGTGQSSWKAELVALAGFTSATTIVVDGTVDGTNWIAKGFKVAGSLTTTTVQSVVGPGPLELSGNCAGLQKIRIRCSVLNSGETITATITASVGTGDVGFLSSLPSGSNYIGYVEDIEQSGYIAATSPPTATNTGSDTSYTFSSQVNRVIIQNNTSANVNYAFDVAATAGSLVLVPGAMLVYPKKCTVLHLYTAAAQNINGTTAANIVVLGAL